MAGVELAAVERDALAHPRQAVPGGALIARRTAGGAVVRDLQLEARAAVADGDAARLVADYAALFAAVSQSVIRYQFFAGDRLPTKKLATQAGRFDWTSSAPWSTAPANSATSRC